MISPKQNRIQVDMSNQAYKDKYLSTFRPAYSTRWILSSLTTIYLILIFHGLYSMEVKYIALSSSIMMIISAIIHCIIQERSQNQQPPLSYFRENPTTQTTQYRHLVGHIFYISIVSFIAGNITIYTYESWMTVSHLHTHGTIISAVTQ
ncbi:MAG: hypothetical protein ACNI27_13180 [Desulfovibrio sp.]